MATILTTVSLLSSLISTGVGLGMVALVLWQAPNATTNRLLALYMGSIAGWALVSLLFRLTGMTDLIKISAFFLCLTIFFLLAVATHYTGKWRYRYVRPGMAILAVFFLVAVPIHLSEANVFATTNPQAFGGSMFQLNSFGRWASLLLFGMTLISSAILWRARKEKGDGLLAPALLAPVSLASLLLPISLPIPMVTAAATSVLLSRVILRQNLFNPLLEVTKVLTASEAHYRMLAEELTRKETLYRTLASNLPNTTVALFDREMRCLVFEGQEVVIRGQCIDRTIEGHVLTDVLPVEIKSHMTELYQAAFSGQEVRMPAKLDGRDFQVHVVPVGDERGNLFAGMIVLQDVNEITAAERQAMALALEKERNSLLRRFISDATHDLMTPMSGMQISIDILQRELKDHPAHRRVDSLNLYTRRLTVLLQDMFEATRLDETDTLEAQVQDMNNLVRDVAKRGIDAAADRHQKFVVEYGNIPPLTVDATMLDRAVMNLVKNAIAYTPDGGTITLTTSVSDGCVEVAVSDTGIGIADDERERIFDRFYRVDKARGMDEGGAGLGLSIARRIVELHGGRIEVSSEPGHGSIFRILLPLPAAESTLRQPA